MKARLAAVLPDLAKGARAATVMLVPFYLATAWNRPELASMALGGWLGTLADPGGTRATRARTLAIFAAAAPPLVAALEAVARVRGLAAPVLALCVFGLALLRAIGGTAGSLGGLLTVVAAIASGGGRSTPLHDAASFGMGALLALVVSSVIWPIWTHLPVRRAVARVYRELADYLAAVAGAIADEAPAGEVRWNTLVRAHHARIRAAIEAARGLALAVRARRQGETWFGSNIRALLGLAEAQFPIATTLAQELEAMPPGARLAAGRRLLRVAEDQLEVERAVFERMYRPLERRGGGGGPAAAAEGDAGAEGPEGLASRLEKEARLAVAVAHGLGEAVAIAAPEAEARPRAAEVVRARLVALRDALSPRSVFFQHAVRAAAVTLVATFLGAWLSPRHGTWVTLTAIVVLQPDPGGTIKRAGERTAGTVLGSLLAALLTVTVGSPLVASALLVPLSVAAVATRPRSYRLFTFFLTPVFVLLAERQLGDWWTAAERSMDAILGGVLALVGGVLVFPPSERERLPDSLGAMLDAVARYAAQVLAGAAHPAGARRAAGIALGAAEASLERYLAEPARDETSAADAMLLVTYARRLATALSAAHTLSGPTHAAQPAVAAYVAAALARASARLRGEPAPAAGPPAAASAPALARVVRWAELMNVG